MSDARAKVDAINAMAAMAFMDDDGIRANFIEKNFKLNKTTEQDAAMFYEQQAIYLKKVIQNSWNPEKPDNYLGNCTTFSLYCTFMDMAVYGDILSFNPEDKLCYVESGNYKAGMKEGQAVWEKRAKLVISPYGELAIRIDYGQIKYADPVVIVREGDLFEMGTNDQCNVIAIWKSKIIGDAPRKIIGSFVKITRPDGSFVVKAMLQEDIDRLAAYSKKKNKSWVNPLYGTGESGIDAGFLRAKTLKHSFQGVFPRIRLKGTNSQIDDMATDDQEGTTTQLTADTVLPEEMRTKAAAAPPKTPASPAISADDWDKPSSFTPATQPNASSTPAGGYTVPGDAFGDEATF